MFARAWDELAYRWRFFLWFVRYPSIYGLITKGWDKPSRMLIYERYEATRPRRKGESDASAG